jgi:hypothetical protein
MKKLINNYGKKTFNTFGVKILSEVEKTDDPEKTLSEIKKLKRGKKVVPFAEYKEVIQKNRSGFVDNRGRPKGKVSKLKKEKTKPKNDSAVWDDPIDWLKEQLNEWKKNEIIMPYQIDLILDFYKLKTIEEKISIINRYIIEQKRSGFLTPFLFKE